MEQYVGFVVTVCSQDSEKSQTKHHEGMMLFSILCAKQWKNATPMYCGLQTQLCFVHHSEKFL